MQQDLVSLFTSWLLVAIIVVGAITLSCLRAKTSRPAYEKILTMVVWLLTIHALHILICHTFVQEWGGVGWAVPYGLLYPALLFMLFKQTSQQNNLKTYAVLLYCAPFFFFFIGYILLVISPEAKDVIPFGVYSTWLFRLIIVSFIAYSLAIWFSQFNGAGKLSVGRLLNVAIPLVMLLSLLFLGGMQKQVNIGADSQHLFGLMICLVMLVSMMLVFWHKLVVVKYVDPYADNIAEVTPSGSKTALKKEDEEQLSIYQKSAVTADRLAAYETKIRAVINDEQLFLDPQCNLEKLSELTGIPRHHLSQVFSLRFQKGFAAIIGELRINHAVTLINKSEERLNMETLAYECGFNSKVSFNRHFKQIVGITPSAYRKLKQK